MIDNSMLLYKKEFETKFLHASMSNYDIDTFKVDRN